MMQSFQFNTVVEVSQNHDKSFRNITQKITGCVLSPQDSQSDSPSPPPTSLPPHDSPSSQVHTLVEKKETLFSEKEDHLWMKRKEGGDPASPINSETATND